MNEAIVTLEGVKLEVVTKETVYLVDGKRVSPEQFSEQLGQAQRILADYTREAFEMHARLIARALPPE